MTTSPLQSTVSKPTGSPASQPQPGSALHAEALAVFEEMYAGYLARDTSRIDVLLADDFTMFDSASFGLVVGFDELAVLRGGRGDSSSGTTETGLHIREFRVFERGADVLACFILEVTMADADGVPLASELSRNTAWLSRGDAGLRIRHVHEDVWTQGGSVGVGE